MSLSLSLCPSVHSDGTACFPLDGFLGNFLCEYFSKICRENSSFKNLTRKTGTLREEMCTFLRLCRRILPRMRKVSDKICRENQVTHFMFSNEIMGQYMIEQDRLQVTI